jgi:hypothetical protein
VYRDEMADIMPRLGLTTCLGRDVRQPDLPAIAAGPDSSLTSLAAHVER